MLSCQKTQDLMSDYIDKQLSVNKIIKFENHIDSCKECNEEYKLLYNITKSCNKIKEVALPKDYKLHLHQKLIENIKHKGPWYLNWKMYSAVAAGVLIVISLKSQVFFYNNYKKAYVNDASLDFVKDKAIDSQAEEENAIYEDIEINNVNDHEMDISINKIIEKNQIDTNKESDRYKESNNEKTDNIDINKQEIDDVHKIIDEPSNYEQGFNDIHDNSPNIKYREDNIELDKSISKSDLEMFVNKEGSNSNNTDLPKQKTNDNDSQRDDANDIMISNDDVEISFSSRAGRAMIMAEPQQIIINSALIQVPEINLQTILGYINDNIDKYKIEFLISNDKTNIMLNEENYLDFVKNLKQLFKNINIDLEIINMTEKYNKLITQADDFLHEIEELETMSGNYIIEIKANNDNSNYLETIE